MQSGKYLILSMGFSQTQAPDSSHGPTPQVSGPEQALP